MDSKAGPPATLTYVALGSAAIVAVLLATRSSSSTSYGVSTGTAQTASAIVAANTNAVDTQAAENVSLQAGRNALITALDTNHTSIILGSNNNSTAVSLANITAGTAQLSDKLNTDAQNYSSELNYQAGVYGTQTNLQASLAAIAARTQQVAIGASETANTNATAADIAGQQAHVAQQKNLWDSITGVLKTALPFLPSGGSVTSNTLPAIGSVGANTASATYA
jgi:hypothetical protein